MSNFWDLEEKRKIDGLTFVLTSFASPEQYEVFDRKGKQVGYLRLRWGRFRVDYPDCGDETLYEAFPKGDGAFEEEEREFYLKEAIKTIKLKIEKKP